MKKKGKILGVGLVVAMCAIAIALIGLGNVVAQEEIESGMTEKGVGEHNREMDSSLTVTTLVRDNRQVDGTAYACVTIITTETGSQDTKEDEGVAGALNIVFILLMMIVALGVSLVYRKLKKKENKFDRILGMGFMLALVAALFAVAVPINVSASDPYPGTPNHYVNPDSLYPEEPYDTWDTASHSIQPAINVAWNGDTVHVAVGTYNEQLTISVSLTLKGADKFNTIIDGGGGIGVDVVKINEDGAKITGFTITGSGSGMGDSGIELNGAQNCEISSNIVSNNEYGIVLNLSSVNLISNNNVSSNEWGVYLYDSDNNDIIENTISTNENGIVLQSDSTGNEVYHNDIIDNTNQADDSSNNVNQWDNGYSTPFDPSTDGGNYWSDFDEPIEGAYDDYNGPDQDILGSDGIVDLGPPVGGKNPYIIDADSQDNYPLIFPWLRVHNVDKGLWYHDIQPAVDEADSGNTIEAGSGTYYENVWIDRALTLTGENRDYTIIDGGQIKETVRITADGANISGFTITNSRGSASADAGICILGLGWPGNNCTITDNNITGNLGPGIKAFYSSGNTIEDNDISNNGYYGILLYSYTTNPLLNTTIINNNISDNTYGIDMGYSQYTTIITNSIYNNTYGIGGFETSNDEITGNNIYDNNFGIRLGSSSNTNITGNDISSNGTFGIDLYEHMGGPPSNNNYITDNNVSSNGDGIWLSRSNNNTITDNDVTLNNDYGIYLNYCTNNLIYHNNFVGNTYQAYDDSYMGNQWDNGYPSAGNYWSDFDEPSEGAYDDYQGEYQDVPGSDGIVDLGLPMGGLNPYFIDLDSWDTYPLKEPWDPNKPWMRVHNLDRDLWYHYIQPAIDDALPGNTLLASSSTYYENVVIDKALTLIGENKNTTIIDGGGIGDVVMITDEMIDLSGFKIMNSGPSNAGIGLFYNVHFCWVTNNIIENNFYGILFDSVTATPFERVEIRSNDISFNTVGIWLMNSFGTIIWQNTVSNGDVGIKLFNSNGNTVNANTISSHWGLGISLYNSHTNGFDNNTVSPNNYIGIQLESSNSNTFHNNHVSYTSQGAFDLRSSCYNYIDDNDIYFGDVVGIRLDFLSNYNTIYKNRVMNTSEGIWACESIGNVIDDNDVLDNYRCGIALYSASQTQIINNLVSGNEGGIIITNSNDNDVIGNTVSNNTQGINLWASSNNRIYHNNIIDNSWSQAWDDQPDNSWDNGYPSGGNYWSDFDEPGEGAYDDYNGPNQDIPGSDGIVDLGPPVGGKNPYYIIPEGCDNYPFINPLPP